MVLMYLETYVFGVHALREWQSMSQVTQPSVYASLNRSAISLFLKDDFSHYCSSISLKILPPLICSTAKPENFLED